jgi:hypothetical protein
MKTFNKYVTLTFWRNSSETCLERQFAYKNNANKNQGVVLLETLALCYDMLYHSYHQVSVMGGLDDSRSSTLLLW